MINSIEIHFSKFFVTQLYVYGVCIFSKAVVNLFLTYISQVSQDKVSFRLQNIPLLYILRSKKKMKNYNIMILKGHRMFLLKAHSPTYLGRPVAYKIKINENT